MVDFSLQRTHMNAGSSGFGIERSDVNAFADEYDSVAILGNAIVRGVMKFPKHIVASRYAVNWEMVFELAAKLKKRKGPKRA